jgi:hypothetical protein
LTQFQEQVYKTGQEILINFQHDQEILWWQGHESGCSVQMV